MFYSGDNATSYSYKKIRELLNITVWNLLQKYRLCFLETLLWVNIIKGEIGLWNAVITLSWHLCTSSVDIWASAYCTWSVEIIRKQLTQASVIVVALTSADAISVFANSLHSGILATTIVWVLPFITLLPVWIGCRWWWGAVCRYRCESWCPGSCWSWCDGGSRAGSWCTGSCWSLRHGSNRAATEVSIPWTCSREMRKMVW